MNDSNYPPGVSEQDLPGCSRFDELRETAYEFACNDLGEMGLPDAIAQRVCDKLAEISSFELCTMLESELIDLVEDVRADIEAGD